ncbi:MAG: BatD family protein, partial [Bacteroidota bacterium]
MKHIATLLLLFTLSAAYGQGHLFSRVKLNRSSVYVGQPVEVTVSVYSSTWFTSGVDPGNIKVEGAFTVYFRSVSQTEKINGKTYAGVDMIFNVFPFEDKDIEFPAVTFHVETPDEGDYKGKPKTVRTKPRKIKVKPIPPGYDKAAWVVTTGLWVNERWSGNLQNVKIGDVLERRIDRTVSNTVSELIPPVVWDSVENIALYPMRPEVMNQKTKTDISASRTDGMRYLFLEEGEVTIPGQVFTWYNPYRKRLYKKTLKARTINVLPNPDLGMLKTVRDSLAMMSTPPQSGEE